MANAVSFDEIIQQGRKKRAAEKLAQEIFGKRGRASAPPSGPKAGLGGSLASRVGVSKPERNTSLPRSTTPRQPRQPNRPTADRSRPSYTQSVVASVPEPKRNGMPREEVANGGGDDLIIRGAANSPFTVIAQNFAPGTTAADIESVMFSVGGEMTSCKLVTSQQSPTVIAEMAFVDKTGAEKVIETFNGKKADGRPLYVFWKHGAPPNKSSAQRRETEPIVQAPAAALAPPPTEDIVMEFDENAESREAENRRREEHRGRDGRDDRARRDVFPTGPRAQQDQYSNRLPQQRGDGYRDARYGYGDGRRGGGFRDGRGPRYDDRRFGGQSWRP